MTIPREQKDWLYIDAKVITPRGLALVNRISDDDGVYTTLGNFCRTELKEYPETEREKVHDAALKILNAIGEEDTACWGVMMLELYDSGMLIIPKDK